MLNKLIYKFEWSLLKSTIKKLLKNERVSTNDLKQMGATNMGLMSNPDSRHKLLESLRKLIYNHLVDVEKLINTKLPPNKLLLIYAENWLNYTKLIGNVSATFHSNHRAHNDMSYDQKIVVQLMLDLWKEVILNHNVRFALLKAPLDVAQRERIGGELLNSEVFTMMCKSILACDMADKKIWNEYKSQFDGFYVDLCKNYHNEKLMKLLKNTGISNYVQYVNESLDEELARMKRYSGPPNYELCEQFSKTLNEILVFQFKSTLAQKIQFLIRFSLARDLQELRKLLKRFDDENNNASALLINGIREEMMHCLREVDDPQRYAEVFLSTHNRFSTLILDAFNEDNEFLDLRDEVYKLCFDKAKESMLNVVTDLLGQERQGQQINTRLIVNVRECFFIYGPEMYREGFSKWYMETCREYYKREISQILDKFSIFYYKQYVDKKRNEEIRRAELYLISISEEGYQNFINRNLNNILVLQFKSQLLDKAHSLIEKNKTKELKEFYDLLKKVDPKNKGIRKEFLEQVKDFIETDFMYCLDELEHTNQYARTLLKTHTQITTMINVSFSRNKNLLKLRSEEYDNIFNENEETLFEVAEELLEQKRAGQEINPNDVISIRQCFSTYDTDYCMEVFEERYFAWCDDFYTPKILEIFDNDDINEYLKYATDKFREEKRMTIIYFDPSSSSVKTELPQIFVTQFQQKILEKERFDKLIRENDPKYLKMLRDLLDKTKTGTSELLNLLVDHFKPIHMEAFRNSAKLVVENPKNFISKSLSIYNECLEWVNRGFHNDGRFSAVCDQVLQEMVNDVEVFQIGLDEEAKNKWNLKLRFVEMLAFHFDNLLRDSPLTKKYSESEIDEMIDKALFISKYVNEKNEFMNFYTSHLKRRLILNLSLNKEKETELNQGMPAQYILKLDSMLKDIKECAYLNGEFMCDVLYGNACVNLFGYQSNFKVLKNTSAWNYSSSKELSAYLPPSINDLNIEFKIFYERTHPTRHLQWAHNWSTAEVDFESLNGKYELLMNGYQLALLSLWNERPSKLISFKDLESLTQIDDLDLKRSLMPMVKNSKTKDQILLTSCKPIDPENFNDQTLFWVNKEFALYKDNKIVPNGRVSLLYKLF